MAKQYEIDAPLTYADYYFIEALIRYKKLLENRPVVETITAFSENSDRSLWLSSLHRISYPLLTNMAKGNFGRICRWNLSLLICKKEKKLRIWRL